MQTANSSLAAELASSSFSSLYRGMAAPLSAAAVINAIVFGSYGFSSRFYDNYIVTPQQQELWNHDPWQKAMACGSFAGLVQCVVICPMEHIKCRLQVSTQAFPGPLDAVKTIVQKHGVQRLFQGWWSTVLREVPAFGLYFACYDDVKDRLLAYCEQGHDSPEPFHPSHGQILGTSALAGGAAGALTWGIVYPVDVIKTRIQTAPLDATSQELGVVRITSQIIAQHGWRYLFRGLSVALIRAFPVNGTIFPVYEFTLMQVVKWENGDS